MITVRLPGLDRLSRALLDQAMTLANDQIDNIATNTGPALAPLDPLPPPMELPPPTDVMALNRSLNR
jgi:hypothetical protein